MDKNLQKDFLVQKGRALSTSLDVSNCNPAKVNNAGCVQDYVIQLAKLLASERVNDCVITQHGKGADGFMSFIQLLDNGLISGHTCGAELVIFTDVFLRKLFDPKDVVNFTQTFFDGGMKSMASKIRK